MAVRRTRRHTTNRSSGTAAAVADEGRETASRAREEGEEVASAAVDEGREVAYEAANQGLEVAESARQDARELGGMAKEQASEVSQEVMAQGRGLLEETRTQLEGQADTQVEQLAQTLRRFGAEAQALAAGRPSEAGELPGYLENVSGRLEGWADGLDERGVWMVAAAAMLAAGKKSLSQMKPPVPEQAMATVKRDIQVAKTSLSRGLSGSRSARPAPPDLIRR